MLQYEKFKISKQNSITKASRCQIPSQHGGNNLNKRIPLMTQKNNFCH